MKFYQFVKVTIFCLIPLINYSQEYPTLDEIRLILKEEVDNGRSSSIAVGIYDNGKEIFLNYGLPFEGKTVKANENTIYELASITKIFVSTIVSDLVIKNKLKLEDPISKYLPDTLKYLDENFKEITIKQLATHTSGIPDNFGDQKKFDYWEYLKELTYDELFIRLEKLKLEKVSGKTFEYSNFNYALLAYVVCKVENNSLENIFNKYYYSPFKMNNTALKLSKIQEINLATPYLRPGAITDYWDLANSSCNGAAGLKSSTKDLMKFMRGLFFDSSSLNDAVKFGTIAQIDSTLFPNTKMGLGWFIFKNNIGHGGKSRHSSSVLMVDTVNKRGVIVLSNSGNSITDICDYIFDKNTTINKYKKIEVMPLSDELFDKIKGKYEFQAGAASEQVEVIKKHQSYFISNYEVFYKGDNSFFVPELKGIIEFTDIIDNKFQSIIIAKNKMKIGKRLNMIK